MCGGSAYRTWQAKIQACISPGNWIPFIRRLHRTTERWKSLDDVQSVFRDLLESIKTLSMNSDEKIEIGEVDEAKKTIQIFFFTDTCQWLDVVDLTFVKSDEGNGTIIQALSYSTGLLPVWLPLCFIWNMIFFLFPFYDWGQTKKHLLLIRGSSECPLLNDENIV